MAYTQTKDHIKCNDKKVYKIVVAFKSVVLANHNTQYVDGINKSFSIVDQLVTRPEDVESGPRGESVLLCFEGARVISETNELLKVGVIQQY